MTPAGMSDKLKPRTRRMAIVNKRGLHARASARFVETVASFDVVIEVEKDGITVGGTSIMGLMMLAASPGCSITVHASGSEAEAALDALGALVLGGFGEES
jgi:phosphocarrier protein